MSPLDAYAESVLTAESTTGSAEIRAVQLVAGPSSCETENLVEPGRRVPRSTRPGDASVVSENLIAPWSIVTSATYWPARGICTGSSLPAPAPAKLVGVVGVS